jgi:Xaa-Pro dipeptidase
MVITVEPGIYLEGKFGIRVEDMVLIKNRAKVLTSIPRELSLNH